MWKAYHLLEALYDKGFNVTSRTRTQQHTIHDPESLFRLLLEGFRKRSLEGVPVKYPLVFLRPSTSAIDQIPRTVFFRPATSVVFDQLPKST